MKVGVQHLSARQLLIAGLIGRGATKQEMADALGVAEGTVGVLSARARKRAGAKNGAHLAVLVALHLAVSKGGGGDVSGSYSEV